MTDNIRHKKVITLEKLTKKIKINVVSKYLGLGRNRIRDFISEKEWDESEVDKVIQHCKNILNACNFHLEAIGDIYGLRKHEVRRVQTLIEEIKWERGDAERENLRERGNSSAGESSVDPAE